MKTSIPLKNYYDEKIFFLEQQRIFSNSWQFIGFKKDLERNRDYITDTIAGIAIIVRNCDNKIKAFHNVCSHRFNKICTSKKGNGFMKCEYHGWAYDDSGLPKGIPGREGFEDLDLKKLALKEYRVDSCGEFIFVNLRDNGNSLKESMPGLYEIIEKIGSSFGEKIDTNEIEINSNWKIVLENTLEEYHVKEVHPESFNKLGILSKNYNFFDKNSMASMQTESMLSSKKKLEEMFQSRPFKISGYQHFLLFPNMTVATAFGTSFSIQQIIPISPGKTKFISHVFSTKLDDFSSNTALRKAFNAQAARFNRQVFDEDAIICETVHEGIKNTDRKSGPLHQDEKRVFAFHQTYMKEMR